MTQQRTPRTFHIDQARRQQVPCLVGLYGASGSGKTYSALRLGKGMEQTRPGGPGKLGVIDTEGGRALHYADQFEFLHMPFAPPFGSLDYLDAFDAMVAQGITTIIVDSMSHEHEGAGGILEAHTALCDANGGDKYKMRAWGILKPLRRKMIHRILQARVNFIFCFRAKEKIKVAAGGRPTPMGWMPIGAEELVYEMTVNCLLLPGCGGVPTWTSQDVGTRGILKLPAQFANNGTFSGGPLDEATGERLGKWARGDDVVVATVAPPANWTEWEQRAGMSHSSLVAALSVVGTIGPGETYEDIDAHRRANIYNRPEAVAGWLKDQQNNPAETTA